MPVDAEGAASLLQLGIATAAVATYAFETFRVKKRGREQVIHDDEEEEEEEEEVQDDYDDDEEQDDTKKSHKKKKKHRMVVQSTDDGSDTSPRFRNARRRMVACGYDVGGCELQEIHCNQQPGCEGLPWIKNGFIQCFTKVDGRRARVMDYAPGQELQPHRHDIDELFEIRGGAVLVSKWVVDDTTKAKATTKQQEEDNNNNNNNNKKKNDGKTKKNPGCDGGEDDDIKGTRTSYRLSSGDLLEIPSGTVHGLLCDAKRGLQFHELVGVGEEAFAKRSTEFLVKKGLTLATS